MLTDIATETTIKLQKDGKQKCSGYILVVKSKIEYRKL